MAEVGEAFFLSTPCDALSFHSNLAVMECAKPDTFRCFVSRNRDSSVVLARSTRIELASSSVTGRPSIPIKLQSRIWGDYRVTIPSEEIHSLLCYHYIIATIEFVVGYRSVAYGGILPLEPLRSSSCAIAFSSGDSKGNRTLILR